MGLSPKTEPSRSAEHDMLIAERDELRERVRDLAARLALARADLAELQRFSRGGSPTIAAAAAAMSSSVIAPPSHATGGDAPSLLSAAPSLAQPTVPARPAEPSQAELRALLRPSELLEELGWPGSGDELGLPIPFDARGILEADAAMRIAVAAGDDELALRGTLCSVLDRAAGPIALSVALGDSSSIALDGITRRLREALPQVEVIRDGETPPGTHLLAAGEELAWGWPRSIADMSPPGVAYLLPGLPPEGSGGSHSLVQEARGLRALGAETRICVPAQALSVASALYGNEDALFAPYESESTLEQAIAGAAVVVATEYISVRPIELLAERHPELLFAYYVQDYEPLFATFASARSDGALLSYRAIPDMLLFAKTHWLRNLVVARHGVPVAKVRPSLDQMLFHAQGRKRRDGPVRVVAMVRPRTPRRRAGATLAALRAIERKMGEGVETLSFGCDGPVFEELCREVGGGSECVTHLGLLTRAQVADVMRSADVFIDASAYQAFGRTGLEAMACGSVPVLPALGGVGEYAANDHDALVLAHDAPEEIADAVCALLADRPRLARLRKAGLHSAAGFSIELAARSQLELFTASLALRDGSATVVRA
jgi:hypothetical protein